MLILGITVCAYSSSGISSHFIWSADPWPQFLSKKGPLNMNSRRKPNSVIFEDLAPVKLTTKQVSLHSIVPNNQNNWSVSLKVQVEYIIYMRFKLLALILHGCKNKYRNF